MLQQSISLVRDGTTISILCKAETHFWDQNGGLPKDVRKHSFSLIERISSPATRHFLDSAKRQLPSRYGNLFKQNCSQRTNYALLLIDSITQMGTNSSAISPSNPIADSKKTTVSDIWPPSFGSNFKFDSRRNFLC